MTLTGTVPICIIIHARDAAQLRMGRFQSSKQQYRCLPWTVDLSQYLTSPVGELMFLLAVNPDIIMDFESVLKSIFQP